jgi:hypothetical protein
LIAKPKIPEIFKRQAENNFRPAFVYFGQVGVFMQSNADKTHFA